MDMSGFMAFDWILFAITGFLSVWFLTGHGEKIIQAFDNNNMYVRRKMKPEEKARFLRACGIFCVVLCLSSLMLALFHHIRIVPIISIVVAVLDIVFFAVYTNKNFPNNPKF